MLNILLEKQKELNNYVLQLELERGRAKEQVEQLEDLLKASENDFKIKNRDFIANSGALSQLNLLIQELEQEQKTKVNKIEEFPKKNEKQEIEEFLEEEKKILNLEDIKIQEENSL